MNQDIKQNSQGYYVSKDNRFSTILTAVNTLKRAKNLPNVKIEKIVSALHSLKRQDPTLYRLNAIYIPLAIEWASGNEFYGRAIAMNADKLLGEKGISPLEKYALCQEYVLISQLPAVFISKKEGYPYGYGLGALVLNKKKEDILLIEDGLPRRIKGMQNIPSMGSAIQLLENEE